MIENYEEIIDKMTHEEAMEIVSKMGMNMSDHPYLSEQRRQELKDEKQQEMEEYENKIKNTPSDNRTIRQYESVVSPPT
jgi:isoaspartyl peptidase/L-asparaginase-like protein (Ntn-hydrolase superfamily)|tara:strand:- start:148 stop:384 length:237 start_codon:yes stop_codon:yes gene_type:complete